MKNNNVYQTQWFIVTAIGGKEELVKKALIEKMTNYGYYGNEVKEIKIFTTKKIIEEIFDKDDQKLPSSLKNSKTITWQTLPNGKYKKIKTTISNRFPNYIFVNMILNSDIWYAIRNTNGVMGFVGSSGKGSMPIPIHINEFEQIDISKAQASLQETKDDSSVNESNVQANDSNPKNPNASNQFKVGNTVIITSGSFAGIKALITEVNLQEGMAKVEFEFFGRNNSFNISFNDLKLEN